MRRIVIAALLAGSAALFAPAAGAAETEPAAAPQQEVSVLAVSLTAGAAVATVGSGVALSVARRRGERY